MDKGQTLREKWHEKFSFPPPSKEEGTLSVLPPISSNPCHGQVWTRPKKIPGDMGQKPASEHTDNEAACTITVTSQAQSHTFTGPIQFINMDIAVGWKARWGLNSKSGSSCLFLMSSPRTLSDLKCKCWTLGPDCNILQSSNLACRQRHHVQMQPGSQYW